MLKQLNVLDQYKNLPSVVYLVSISVLINSFGNFIKYFLPIILTDKLSISISTSGMIISVLVLSFTVGMPFGGIIGDKFGRIRVFVFFQILSGLLYIVAGFITNIYLLITLLIVSYFIRGCAIVLVTSVIMDGTVKETSKQSFSLLYLFSNLGASLGPAIGALLIDTHLSLLFIFDGLTAVISGVLVFIFIKPVGKDFSAKKNEPNDKNTNIALFNKKNILIFALFSVGALVSNFIYSQFNFSLPLNLKSYINNSVQFYAYIMSLNAILVLLITPIVLKLLRNISIPIVLSSTGLIYFLSIVIIQLQINFITLTISCILWTFAEVLFSSFIYVFLSEIIPEQARGKYTGIFEIFLEGGAVLAPLISGYMINIFSFKINWIFILVLCILSSFIYFNLGKFIAKQKRDDNENSFLN